ncbi:hypothetical protein JCM11491_000682 [Sporobolomyces phaffii]
MDQLQRELLKEVSHLPPGTNPYDFIDNALLKALSPRRPRSFEVQLVLCMIAHGLCGFLILGSIVVRIYKKSFWLVRVRIKNPNLWRPHFTAGWSLWALVLVVFLELAVFNALSSSRSLEPQFAYWWTLAWIPAWMGGFSAAWAITVSLLLHVHSSGRDTSLVEKLSPFVNLGSILFPVLYLAVIIPFALRCAASYESAIYEIQTIRHFLHARATTFNGQFTLVDLAPVLPTMQKLETAYFDFLRWLRITFALYAGSACLLVFLLATVAIIYVHVLRRALDDIGDSANLRENGQAQRIVVEKTYSTLNLTLISFTTIGCIFTGLSLYIAIEPESLASQTAAGAVCLIAFYSFALFGLPTSFLLFIRSFDRTTSESSASDSKPSLARGRSHSHIPSISLPFRRKSSTDFDHLASVHDGKLKDDGGDGATETSPPHGFEIVFPVPGADHQHDDPSYPPRPPLLPHYASQRCSRSSTIDALYDSGSTRTSVSMFVNSPTTTPRDSTGASGLGLKPDERFARGGSETSLIARAGSLVSDL